jgi:hypothetical protein
MRPVICALRAVVCFFPVLSGADLMVVLDFESTHSSLSVAEMKAETERLLTASGVSVGWRSLKSFVPGESFPKLAVVKFTGRCELTPIVPPAPENGSALGFTYRIDGRIAPFSEVECDRVLGTIGAARIAAAGGGRDLMYGRALGRVLAHELFHILSGSKAHSKHGVTQRYLSPATLVEDRM